ncbi:MAG: zinc ribbon domain-containing protein [Clostridia bacterium]|nr:zinc ribbon domain-containing protein [Clostridia bacterium]
MGIGLGTMAGVGGVVGGMVGGVKTDTLGATQSPQTVSCGKCGAKLPQGAKFCLECGEKVEEKTAETIVCPTCGKTVVKGKFCPECGHKFVEKCPKCNADLPAGAKFCLNCGERI